MGKRIEVTPGDRYGRWTVVREDTSVDHRRRVLCKCECGAERLVLLSSLCTGQSMSCCCLQREASRKTGHANKTHGMRKSTTYNVWSGLRQRCLNPRNAKFSDYGARGIAVCQRWIDSFEAFLSDMGERPSSEHSIERLNVNGDYEPSNCCWATQTVQQRNRRNNLVVTFRGESHCLSVWAEILGIPYGTLHGRLSRGVPVEEALR